MKTDDNAPATKRDLAELKADLRAEFKAELKAALAEMREPVTEQIRDSRTEILRVFEKSQTGNTIRMRKLEANQSNLDTSTSMRLDHLEERLREIGKRLSWGVANSDGRTTINAL